MSIRDHLLMSLEKGPFLIKTADVEICRIVHGMSDEGLVVISETSSSALLNVAPMPDVEEGMTCPCLKCEGSMQYRQDSCTCFISAPCGHCENAWLECSECGWRRDDGGYLRAFELDQKEKTKMAVFGDVIGSW